MSDSHTVTVAILALKLMLAPALIGIASWMGRRWGPGVAGWFSALPLTSGPVVLVLALERGPAFAADACIGILLAVVSLAAFALAYAWTAHVAGRLLSAVLGCSAYVACISLLQHSTARLGLTFIVACSALTIALRLMPRADLQPRPAQTPAWDIPVRMSVAGTLVWALTRSADLAGPRLGGLLTPFPIAATILASFTHRFDGSAAAAQLLRSLLAGLFSFAVFFLAFGEWVVRQGVVVAFAAATAAALVTHAFVWIGARPRLTIQPVKAQ